MGVLGLAVRALTNRIVPNPIPSLPEVLPDSDRTSPVEQRRAARSEVELLLAATAPNGDEYRGYSRDISGSGMAALLWGDLKLGDEVCLRCRFSGCETEVNLRAVVRRQVGYRYGLQFLEEHSDRTAVDRLLWIAGAPAQGDVV